MDNISSSTIPLSNISYKISGDIIANGVLSDSIKLISSGLGKEDKITINIELVTTTVVVYKGSLRVKYSDYSYNANYDYSGDQQVFTAPTSGIYKIELWGAQGGSTNGGIGGKGAYTTGKLNLKKDSVLYVNVGEFYDGYRETSNFNGGGHGGYGTTEIDYYANGGGATDVRLLPGSWNNFDGLKSRIMVAAGGGGGGYYYNGAVHGGAGGTLAGEIGTAYAPYTTLTGVLPPGGTQISGAGFGYGGESDIYTAPYFYSSGGGGGYYGGEVGNVIHGGVVGAAAGGSSYISGYLGCNAISNSSTVSQISHTGDANHYSGYIFTSSNMISGSSSMPTKDGLGTMIGNSGNGYARITFSSFN